MRVCCACALCVLYVCMYASANILRYEIAMSLLQDVNSESTVCPLLKGFVEDVVFPRLGSIDFLMDFQGCMNAIDGMQFKWTFSDIASPHHVDEMNLSLFSDPSSGQVHPCTYRKPEFALRYLGKCSLHPRRYVNGTLRGECSIHLFNTNERLQFDYSHLAVNRPGSTGEQTLDSNKKY